MADVIPAKLDRTEKVSPAGHQLRELLTILNTAIVADEDNEALYYELLDRAWTKSQSRNPYVIGLENAARQMLLAYKQPAGSAARTRAHFEAKRALNEFARWRLAEWMEHAAQQDAQERGAA